MSRSHAFFFTARHALCVNLLLWISLAQATGTGTSLVDTSEDFAALDEVSHHGRINKASSLLSQSLVHLQGISVASSFILDITACTGGVGVSEGTSLVHAQEARGFRTVHLFRA